MDITSISAVVAAIGVIVGVVFAVLELRNLVKTRQTDLAMRLHSTWISGEMINPFLKIMNLEFKDYTDFKKRYGSFLSENPEQMAFLSVINHFEGMGYLLQKKVIDVGLIRLLPVSITWERMKPIVEGIREQFDDPGFYEMSEYLYNEMQKREQQLATT